MCRVCVHSSIKIVFFLVLCYMPYKKPYRSRKPFGKKSYLKRKVRKYGRYHKTAMLKQVGFPTNRVVKMRYVQANLLTSTSGVIAQQFFRANSIFDPDFTAGGHQPLGRDQWAVFYNEYVVLGAKLKARFNFISGTVPIQVGVFLNNSSTTTGTSFSELNEQGRCKDNVLNASSASKSTVITKTYSAKRFHNVVDVKDNVATLGAVMSTNPTAIADYVVFAQAQDTSGTVSCRVLIEIDYIVSLSSPNEIGQS